MAARLFGLEVENSRAKNLFYSLCQYTAETYLFHRTTPIIGFITLRQNANRHPDPDLSGKDPLTTEWRPGLSRSTELGDSSPRLRRAQNDGLFFGLS